MFQSHLYGIERFVFATWLIRFLCFNRTFMELKEKDLEGFYENNVQPMVSDFEDFDSLRSFLNMEEKIKDEIEEAEDDEIVITCCGEYYDTIKERPMAYHYDAHSYAIGLIDID